jgi:hypothetical protein
MERDRERIIRGPAIGILQTLSRMSMSHPFRWGADIVRHYAGGAVLTFGRGDWVIRIEIPGVESQFEISNINPGQNHPNRNRGLSSLSVAMTGTQAENREFFNRKFSRKVMLLSCYNVTRCCHCTAHGGESHGKVLDEC